MSRFGGFRKGRKRIFQQWDDLKADSAPSANTPTAIEELDYTTAKGIWNLRSTMQFPKQSSGEGGGGTPPAPSFSASYVTSTSVGATAASYTFTSVSIGDADANRTVVVTVSWNAGATNRLLSSATIGGVSATLLQTSAAAGWERSAIIYADVSSGTTANIVLNFNGTIGRGIAIGVFRLLNVTTVISPVYDAHNNSGTTYTTNISVNSGDYVISALGVGNGVANWTNSTERYTYTKFNDYLEGASTTAVSTGTLSVSSTGSTYGVLTTVAFR